jgi:translocation and assembly module TamB
LKHPRIRRILKWLGISLAVLLLLTGGAVWFLLDTQSGARFLFARLGSIMPGSFEVDQINGPISGPLKVQNLVYKRPGLEVHVAALELDWRLRELVDRRLDIRRLAASGIQILSTPSRETTPTSLPDLNMHFNIIVHDAQVRGLTVGAPGDPHPMVIDSIDLSTSDIANVVRVDRLAVRSAILNADIQGTVQPTGDYPVQLALRWSAHPAGSAALAGNGQLAGTLKALRIAQSLAQPFPVFVSGVVTDAMNNPAFDGRVNFDGANPHLVMASLPDLPASGQLVFKGDADTFTSTGSVQARVQQTGLVAVHYAIGRDRDKWQIDRADVTFPGAPSTLSAKGKLELGQAKALPNGAPASSADQPLNANLDLQWHQLAWPPRGTPSFTSPGGSAHIEAKGTLNQLASSGTLAASLAPVGPVQAQYTLRRQADTWEVQSLRLAVPGRATVVNLQGKANLAGAAPSLEAHATWRAASWPLNGPPSIVSQQGEAQVRGRLDHYQATLRADLSGPAGGSIPPGQWSLDGSGDTHHMHLDHLAAAILNGQITGNGEVAWDPQPNWNLQLHGDGIDPTSLRPDFPGKLAFSATTRGSVPVAGVEGSLALTQLSGTLRKQPISATAAVDFRGSNLAISNADLKWSTAHLHAQGKVGDALDLTWSVEAPNLSIALPDIAGGVTGTGHLGGTMSAPRVQATLQADGLRSGTQSLAHATVTADVDLSQTGPLKLAADLKGVSASGTLIDDVGIHLNGTTAAHTLQLTATGWGGEATAKLALAASGALNGGLTAQAAWKGTLQTLDASTKAIGSWSLDHGVAVNASAKGADARDFCWHSGPGKACLSAAWVANGPWSANVALTALPLSLAKTLLPSDVVVTGAINGHLQAAGGPRGLTTAQIDVTPGPGSLRFPGAEGAEQEVSFDAGTIRGQAGPQGGTLDADLTFKGMGTTKAQLRLPQITQGVPFARQPLSGHVEVHWTSLAVLSGLVPDLQKPEGSLNASLDLSGTAGSPRLQGKASLTNGRLRVPRYGLDVRDIRFDATGDGSGALVIDASARSGKGTVTVKGKAGLAASTTMPMHLTMSGQHFQVINTTDMAVEVSPQLDLTYEGTSARLEGQILVPFGRVQVDQRGKAGPIEPSKDVVMVSSHPQTKEAGSAPLSITARVRLIVPENSFDLNAYGLAGRPYGEVTAIDLPGKPTVGVGQLQIDSGTFQAYGANLNLDRARLLFTNGPIDDPTLDIRASRKSEDQTVTAGVNVNGTVSAPKVAVWSSPTMDTSDALAYMVLGHPLGQASASEGNTVANAATSLGLKGGNLIAAKIGARFGLQQVSLESTGGLSQTSLMLGKYLSPRIYVMYGVGLFQPINTFRVRYIINKRFTVQAESAAGSTGGDLLYTFEH